MSEASHPTSNTIADPFTPAQNKAYELYLEIGGIIHMLGNEDDVESAIQNLEAIMERLHGEFTPIGANHPFGTEKCPDCGARYIPGARHFSGCASHPGELAQKATAGHPPAEVGPGEEFERDQG